MKIGLVCPYNIERNSGVMAVVLALQSGLQAKGHTVKVITPRPRGWKNGDLPDVIFMGVSADFRSPAQTTTQLSSRHDEEEIDAILEAEKFDILHFHEPWVPLLSRQLLQRSQSVNIATFHQKIPETIMTRTLVKVVNPYFRSVMKYLHVMTAVSEAGAEYAAGITEQPIEIIPNGVDLAKYRQPQPRAKGSMQTILFIGRLEGRKGLKYLLQAYQLLVDKHPRLQLLVAGDGDLRERLEMAAEDLQLPNVKFLGYISEEQKVQLLAQADLFCSPALFGESFGIVLLEAMASGAVTVAGNNSGYAELMKGVGRLSLVNPRDIEEFARRLELLLTEESLRKAWQAWAADYVKEFSYDKVVSRYEKLYQDALSKYGPKTSRLPKHLKIGLILDASLDPPDGVQQYVANLGEWLRGQGHDVHYLVGETNQRQLSNIHSLSRNVGVRFNGNRTTIPLAASRQRLRILIQQHHFDVLHVQTPHHPLMAQYMIMAASPQTAVIGTFHILPEGWPTRIGNRSLSIWLRPSLTRLDKLLAVSPAAAEFANETFGLNAEVLPNVVDYQVFHLAKPLDKYDDDDILTILFLGRLVPRKGAQMLLKAVAKLAREPDLPKFRLIVCGTGPQKSNLQKFIDNHDLGNIVSLIGFVPEEDKPRYYASADIAVFPSRGGESFGIVLIEAMASGRSAVLAGDNPGYRSVMAPHPELLFDPLDADALAKKLRYYLTNNAERRQAGQWAGHYARDFDINVVGPKLLKIYQQALRKRRTP